MTEVLVPFINAFLIVDADGDRIIAKYYNNKPKTEQIKFETLIQKKTKSIGLKSDGNLVIIYLLMRLVLFFFASRDYSD